MYEPNVLSIVLGTLGGLAVVLVSSFLIYLGYRNYKSSKSWSDSGKKKKYRMYIFTDALVVVIFSSPFT